MSAAIATAAAAATLRSGLICVSNHFALKRRCPPGETPQPKRYKTGPADSVPVYVEVPQAPKPERKAEEGRGEEEMRRRMLDIVLRNGQLADRYLAREYVRRRREQRESEGAVEPMLFS